MPLKIVKKKLIIFDLDGVLINSLYNMSFTWSAVCKKFNLKIPFYLYKKNIGLPFLKILENLKIKNNQLAIQKYYKKISKNNLDKIKVYPGTKKVLLVLKKNNKIAIFTSKDQERTKLVIKKIGIKFDYVVTPENIKLGKPNPEGINKIINFFKFKKKDCIYIGDSVQDYLASKKTKVYFLFVKWGYGKLNFKSKKISKIDDIFKHI